ncbi:MAG: hypothetical protein ACREOO_19475 [bacterium]
MKLIGLAINPSALSAKIDSLMRPFQIVEINAVTQIPYHAELAHDLYRLLFEPVEKAFPLPERIMKLLT